MNNGRFQVKKMSPSETDRYDMAVGVLLTDLTSFHDEVSRIREQLGIEVSATQFDLSSDEGIVSALDTIDADKTVALKDWARSLAGKYRLSNNWYLPFRLLALTDTLLVPHDGAIGFQYPSQQNDLVGAITSLEDGVAPVGMYFSYKVTAHEIGQYIRQHQDEFNRMIQTLPPKPQSAMEPHSFILGRLASWLRHDTPQRSWDDIAEIVNRVSVGQGISLNDLDAISVRTAAQRYEQRLSRLDQ